MLNSEVRAGLGDLVLGIDHVGIAVPDLDAALATWAELAGLQVVHREENTAQLVVEVMLAAPGTAGGVQLQLLAPLQPDSPVGRFLHRRGGGLHHLALRVADLAAATSRLQDRGLGLLYPEPALGTSGSKINFVHPRDTAGVLLELVQASQGSPEARPRSRYGEALQREESTGE